jgi:hypothetical protein
LLADDLNVSLQTIQEQAVAALAQAKKKQAEFYDRHRCPSPVFFPGDLVMLSRRFIQTHHTNFKLDFRHLGPFKVIQMIGTNAVKLDISAHYPLLHPVFVGLYPRTKQVPREAA